MKAKRYGALSALLVCLFLAVAIEGMCGTVNGESARDPVKQSEMINAYLASLPVGGGEAPLSSPVYGTAAGWYDMAFDYAHFWSSDVAPVAIFNTDTLVLDGTCRGWGYSFHSQGMDSVYYVQVGDAEVQFGQPQPPLFTDPISGNWVDSDDILVISEGKGGSVYRAFNTGVLVQTFLTGQLYDPCITDSYYWTVGYTSGTGNELDIYIRAKNQAFMGYHSECGGSYMSAAEALQTAEAKALTWAADAGLFRVESRGVMDYQGRATSWAFEYMSNDQRGKRLYCTCDDSAFTDRSTGVRGSWLPVEVEDGWLDSDAAVVCAEVNGGLDYRLEHPLCAMSAFMIRSPTLPFDEHLWSVHYDDLYGERLMILVGTESGIFRGAFNYKKSNDSLFTSNVFLPEATAEALVWSSDACLFGVANVLPLSFPHKGSSTAWGYLFYSSQLNEAVSVTIQATGGGPRVAVKPFSIPWHSDGIAEGWLESDSVLVIAGHAGGNNVGGGVEEPVIETIMTKGVYPEEPERAVWLVSYHSSCQSGTFYLDAYSGIILDGGLGIEDSGESMSPIPRSVELMQNYPNPFNPSTVVRYNVAESGGVQVTLRIYDIHGRYVRGLVDGVKGEGSHSVQWDGRNDHGERVSSGVYLMRLDAGSTTSVRKMIMIK